MEPILIRLKHDSRQSCRNGCYPISHPDYKNRRLLVVQPLGLEDEAPDTDFIALDNTHAGIGDTVLINREGNGAHQGLQNPDACILSVIVGIVDSVYLEE